jgi:hypothetical protein
LLRHAPSTLKVRLHARVVKAARKAYRRGMASGRYIVRGSMASALLGVVCGLLLTAGCGSRAEHLSGQRAAVKAELRRECARIKPRVPMGSAPRLAGGELAPAGASMIRLCRFSGTHAVPPQPLSLVHSADVRATAHVDRLIRELNRLPPMPAAVSCPNDNLSQIVLLLSYPHGQTLVIDVELSGCQTVTNGSVYRIAARGNGPRLIADLRQLTRRR